MAKRIPPLDLMWLLMETQASPMHVGALLLFEKPKGRPRVVHEIVDAYRRYTPTSPFNRVPEMAAAVPHFREVTTYDPKYHIQHLALPAGAAYDDLLSLVASLHEPMLDRDRPLFRNWFIDGVPNNRFALYTKVHHAIVDGVSGIKMLYDGMSTSRKRGVAKPAFALESTVRSVRAPRALRSQLQELGATATHQTRAIRDVSVAALRKTLSTLMGAAPSGSMPFTAHHGPLNAPMRMARSLATLSLPLDSMHAVARHFDATLNDLAVTLVDHGVHRYLRGTGRAFEHRMVAFCPVSLRDESDTSTGTRVSAMFVHLGEPEATATERIRQVSLAMSTAKQEMRAMSKDAAMMYAVSLLGLAELTTVTHIDRLAPPLANVVISNVAGTRHQMHLNGAPLVGVFPASAIAMSVGLNVTLTSCHDRMDFGFVANSTSLPGLQMLADEVANAYGTLESATRNKRRTSIRR